MNFAKIKAALSARLKTSVGAALAGGAIAGNAAFAQTGGSSMDVSTLLATIAAVVVAVNLVGPAWAGVKVLKKAWNKVS